MKYLIYGFWRDEEREYLANKINEKLYIYVAGGWRPALWIDDNGEGLAGYKCFYPVQRWDPPYLFIQVRYVEFMGDGIWNIYRNKIGGGCAWSDREKLCYNEIKKNKGKEHDVIYLNGSARFKGLGDVLISKDDDPVCAVDVVASDWDKSKGRFLIQTRHKDKLGWIEDMRNRDIIPAYAFFLSSVFLPKKFNYLVLSDEAVNRFFRTKRGEIKKANIDFTKNNLWGDNEIPKDVKGWERINSDFMTVKNIFGYIGSVS